MRRQRLAATALGFGILGAIAVTAWIALPTYDPLPVNSPSWLWTEGEPTSTSFTSDLSPLRDAFQGQRFRSFCGPATIATILRAYGMREADQTNVFPSVLSSISAFYTGMTLAELAELARASGLRAEIVYADQIGLDEFRQTLKTNLSTSGDFVVVNYDRRSLDQAGAGHISAVGAYDETRDAFLVLDQAAFRYPFTWLPADALYQAVRTRDGDSYRGVMAVQGVLGREK